MKLFARAKKQYRALNFKIGRFVMEPEKGYFFLLKTLHLMVKKYTY